MKKNKILFWGAIIFAVSFAYALPTYNKFWFPFDEGMTLAAADIINHGGIPYKDFITPFGPAQFYILSFLFKIFGSYLEVAHLYIILLHSLISIVIFYLSYKLSCSSKYAVFLWLVGMSCLAPRIGSTAWSIWPLTFFSILSALSFLLFIEHMRIKYAFTAGFLASLALLSRYELGCSLVFAELTILILLFLQREYYRARSRRIILFRSLGAYLSAVIILPLTFIVYAWKTNFIHDLFHSILLPYIGIIKSVPPSFPAPCLNPVRIFYGSMEFITINQNYIPIIVYMVTAVVGIYLYAKKKIDKKYGISLLFLTMLGVLLFSYAYYGADVSHLMPVIFPSLILSAFLFRECFKNGLDKAGFVFMYFIRFFGFLILILWALLFIKNTDKFIKNTYVKPFTGESVLLQSRRGGIYVPKKEITAVKKVIEIIDANTSPEEKIFIGFKSHKDTWQGGEPMIYFLADRLPATKHFIMFPGTFNKEKIQEEIIASLKDVNLIVLGNGIGNNPGVENGAETLDAYIKETYKPYAQAGTYLIYVKKD